MKTSSLQSTFFGRAFLLPSLFRIALCILLLTGSDFVRAQQSQPTRLDLSVTYIGGHTLKADTSENFWVQGGSIELGANIVHGWSIVANTQQPANVYRFCRWCGGCRGTPDRAGCCPRRNRSTLGQLPAQRSEEEVGVKLFKRVHIEATVMRTAKARLQKHRRTGKPYPHAANTLAAPTISPAI